jgi:hypothetical protein
MDFPAHKNWTRQEERRRLWWSIWELDSFAAAVACRRPTVDKRNMQVMIPVSDENWFSDTPVESDILDPSSSKSWRTLEKRENQDPRAWYLVANFILLSAHDLAQSKNSSQEEARALETAVACFFLIFPSDFNISSASLSFTKERYQRSNWIISINIMLQGYEKNRNPVLLHRLTVSNHASAYSYFFAWLMKTLQRVRFRIPRITSWLLWLQVRISKYAQIIIMCMPNRFLPLFDFEILHILHFKPL